jgi:hypothetical protein
MWRGAATALANYEARLSALTDKSVDAANGRPEWAKIPCPVSAAESRF